MQRSACRLALACLAGVAISCARLYRPVDIDPDATFGAHRAHGAIVIDRLPGGGTGALKPARRLRLPGTPTYVLSVDGAETVALWVGGGGVVVRRHDGSDTPPVGEVKPIWEDGSIRLAIDTPDGTTLRTDAFAREGGGTGMSTLTRATQASIDVRGTYRATVRDPKGAAAGWLRLRVGPYLAAPRIYDGVLPASLPPGLAAATAAALDAEVDWIEDHAVDVYRGDGGDGLERSIPAPR